MIMADRWSLLLLVCVVVLASCLQCTTAEIHRAKAAVGSRPHRPSATYHRRAHVQQEAAWRTPTKLVDAVKAWLWSWTSTERIEIWAYSVIASAVVGLSGIFPLLVIPLETGEALRRGAAANEKLKLLLSFAVGGLLGDVFLHLLPEAWAHVDKLGGQHDGNIQIGLWVLTGLLTFMIIEKIFPESGEDENSEDPNSTNHSEVVKKDGVSEKDEMHRLQTTESDRVQNGFCKTDLGHDVKVNGIKKNGLCTSTKGNGTVTNGHIVNGQCLVVDRNAYLEKNGFKKNGHWKVTGDVTMNGYKNGHCGVVRRHKDNCASEGRSSHTEDEKNSEQSTSHRDVAHDSEHVQANHIKTCGWLNLLANMIDNFTHGLAVAGSFSVGIKTGLITTFAILLHEIPHEIGDFAILLRAGFDRWKAAKAQLLTATGGMLGAVAALSAESAQSAGDRTAWILPFTSGGFIYIALVTVVPDLLQDSRCPWQSLKQFALMCTGIAVMASVTIFVD